MEPNNIEQGEDPAQFRYRGWVWQLPAAELPWQRSTRWASSLSVRETGFCEMGSLTGYHQTRDEAVAHVRAELQRMRNLGSMVADKIEFREWTNSEFDREF